MVFEPLFTTAKSSIPSFVPFVFKLKSAVTIWMGPVPVGNCRSVPNRPVPSPSIVETLLSLTVAISSLPSRFQSPTAIPEGLPDTNVLIFGPKPPKPLPGWTVTSGLPDLIVSNLVSQEVTVHPNHCQDGPSPPGSRDSRR